MPKLSPLAYAVQWARSLIYIIQASFMMLVVGLAWMPWALFSRRGGMAGCHAWAAYACWSARWIIGLETEVRGTPPDYPCIVAGKHQSFLDIIMIFHAIPAGRFIMKRQILWTPIIGLYAMRINCIAVDRGKRAQAIKKMLADVHAGDVPPGQLIIFPQGTRIKPGVKAKYKVGTGVLYQELNQPVVPVATNAGLFWPKRGIMRYPGTAIVEYLDPIQPGLSVDEFTAKLGDVIETRSDALMAEAGFVVDE